MEFTFGIITTGQNQYLSKVIGSIKALAIPNYEIVIVGGNGLVLGDKLIHLPFDESTKPNWITRKKNLITTTARYDNVVFLHDYLALDRDWYTGFLAFGDQFDVCVTKMLNPDGSRFRDWCVHDDPIYGHQVVPYSVKSAYWYINGNYWVAKKSLMERVPLNEDLCWGEGEDLEWSNRLKPTYDLSLNLRSTAHCLKYKSLDITMAPE